MTYSVLVVRMLIMRYLSPPRPFPVRYFSEPDPKTGRIVQNKYLKEPWYVPPTLSMRWGLDSFLTRLAGGTLPGDEGVRFMPEGFLFEELGPQKTMGEGVAETNQLSEPAAKKASAPAVPFWSPTKA